MNKETKSRLERKLMNAGKEIDSLDAFLQVHNEDDESKTFRRLCEMQDELQAMSTALTRMFDRARELKAEEF